MNRRPHKKRIASSAASRFATTSTDNVTSRWMQATRQYAHIFHQNCMMYCYILSDGAWQIAPKASKTLNHQRFLQPNHKNNIPYG